MFRSQLVVMAGSLYDMLGSFSRCNFSPILFIKKNRFVFPFSSSLFISSLLFLNFVFIFVTVSAKWILQLRLPFFLGTEYLEGFM